MKRLKTTLLADFMRNAFVQLLFLLLVKNKVQHHGERRDKESI